MSSPPPQPRPDPDGSKPAAGDDNMPGGIIGSLISRLTSSDPDRRDKEAFLAAVARGDAAAVAAALKAGICPDTSNTSGESALHLAARKDRGDIVTQLLQAGANTRSDKGDSPLQVALNYGSSNAAEALIKGGAFVQEAPGCSTSLLHRACEKGKTQIVAALIEAGADPLLETVTRTTPLVAALNSRQHETAAQLLKTPEITDRLNVTLPGDTRTAFHLAVSRGDARLVGAMAARGAFINAAAPDGKTPLLFAIARGDADIVATLIEAGADVTAPVFSNDETPAQLNPPPLIFAATVAKMDEKARAGVMECLIAAGADLNAADAPTGNTALHALMRVQNNETAVSMLLRHGAATAGCNNEGATPLMLAVEFASTHVTANLLSAGADPNARHDVDARTPLMIAAALGLDDTLKELLQAGANPRLLDAHGRSALFYAQANTRRAKDTVPHLETALRRDIKPLLRIGRARPGRNGGGAP